MEACGAGSSVLTSVLLRGLISFQEGKRVFIPFHWEASWALGLVLILNKT